RAGTLRRIAVALDVPMEDLLGHNGEPETVFTATDRTQPARPPRTSYGWLPTEGGPLTMPSGSNFSALPAGTPEEPRFAVETLLKGKSHNHEAVFIREGELISKLHALLHSPLGDCITRVVDELYALLPQEGSSS